MVISPLALASPVTSDSFTVILLFDESRSPTIWDSSIVISPLEVISPVTSDSLTVTLLFGVVILPITLDDSSILISPLASILPDTWVRLISTLLLGEFKAPPCCYLQVQSRH